MTSRDVDGSNDKHGAQSVDAPLLQVGGVSRRNVLRIGGAVAGASVIGTSGSLLGATEWPLGARTAQASVEHFRRRGGVLRRHPTNRRYFTNDTGKAIYLAGSHTWETLQDRGKVGGPLTFIFDYPAFLDFLVSRNHNFMKMWMIEGSSTGNGNYYEPVPFVRTGPGETLDGRLKYDLFKFNQEYFDRLRTRVIAAGDAGIYVSIMLFQGWSIYRHERPFNPWMPHYFNGANNINGIDGDANGDGEGRESHDLVVAAVTERQEAYVKKVIDTVNDLDNVLYEVSNETAVFSADWQYHMIDVIKSYEAKKPKQHPVGITAFDSARPPQNEILWSSAADWVSPGLQGGFPDGTGNYQTDPPPVTGLKDKVELLDTDHIFGVGGDQKWVWRSFTRGYNTTYMDFDFVSTAREPARKAMGHTLTWANQMGLANMEPSGALTSSGYALANPGLEYLLYLPSGGTATLDLSRAPGTFNVTWIHPVTGAVTQGDQVGGKAVRSLTTPFAGDSAVHVRVEPSFAVVWAYYDDLVQNGGISDKLARRIKAAIEKAERFASKEHDRGRHREAVAQLQNAARWLGDSPLEAALAQALLDLADALLRRCEEDR